MSKKSIFPFLIIAVLSIVFICCYTMMSRIEDRLFVSVDKFHMGKSERITIGDNSDVCYDKIPNDYLSVSFLDGQDSIVWEVNPHYIQSDSLCYLKINNSNPNRHDINSDDRIRISHDSINIELSIDDLLHEIDDKCRSEYIAVKWLLAHRQYRDTTFCHGYNFIEDKCIKSFIWRAKSDEWFSSRMANPELVILDTITTLIQGNNIIGFNQRGSVPSAEGIKVQFCKITASSYQERKVKNKYFHIDDVNYIMKPVIVTTEWGAGHILLKRQNNMVDVLFPKPITYIETLSTLDSLAKSGSGILTFRQIDRSSLITNDLFFPTFSRYLNQDVCAIYFDGASVICDKDTITYQSGFLPKIKSHRSQINPDIDMRLGIMGLGYYLSFLKIPFIVFLICCIMLFFLFNTNLSIELCRTAQTLRWYSLLLFAIAFAYTICRILITIKLSYTYPYFDKLAGIIPISTSAFLLLVFNLSLLFNHTILAPPDLEKYEQPRFLKLHRKWWAFGTSVILWIGICYCMIQMDKTNNASVLGSYLSIENASLFPMKNLDPLSWGEKNAMNDLHRNVPFTLLFVNAMVISAMCLLNVNIIKKWFSKLLKHVTDKIIGVGGNKYIVWGKTILLAIPVFLFTFIPGNYATFIITLLLIPFLSVSLSQIPIDKYEGFDWKYLLMAGITVVIFIISAVLFGDKGYITNILGLFISIIVLYILLYKDPTQKKKHIWNKRAPWIMGVLLFIFMVLLFGIVTSSKSSIYERYNQRAGYNFNYNDYLATGYRSALNSSEFMHVLTHYMHNTDCSDPLSPETHPLHTSVSSGQTPVILNDVSVPGAFLGAYGITAYIPYLGLALLLLVLVLFNTFSNKSDTGGYTVISRYDTCRTLAVFMWVGTTIYLFFSYINVPFFPFTGRLNPGLGVDSVGEALESAVLLAFMLITGLKEEKPQ